MKPDVPMESGLGELIGRIKAEGVDEARRQAEALLAAAREEAEAIVAEARRKADTLREEAERAIRDREATARDAIALAVRDALIQVRRAVEGLFDEILRRECAEALSGEGLERVLLGLAEAWGESPMEILLCEEDKAALSDRFIKRLQETLKGGVEIRVHPAVKGGFRVGIAGGKMHYDFTDEGIAQLLSLRLAGEGGGLFAAPEKRERGRE